MKSSCWKNLLGADAIAIGPGLGKSNLAENLVRTTLENAAVPMVVDADALGILAEHLQWLKKAAYRDRHHSASG